MEVRAVVHEPADLGTTDVTAPGAGVNRTGPPPVMALPALAFFGVFALLPLGGGGGAEPDALGRHRRPKLGRFEPLTPGQNFPPATRLCRAAGREVVKRMAPRFALC